MQRPSRGKNYCFHELMNQSVNVLWLLAENRRLISQNKWHYSQHTKQQEHSIFEQFSLFQSPVRLMRVWRDTAVSLCILFVRGLCHTPEAPESRTQLLILIYPLCRKQQTLQQATVLGCLPLRAVCARLSSLCCLCDLLHGRSGGICHQETHSPAWHSP